VSADWVHAAMAMGGVIFSAGVAMGGMKWFIKSQVESTVRLESKIDGVAGKLEEHRKASKERDEEIAEKLHETREELVEMRGRLLGPFNGSSRASVR
jgi:hypothetical protein